jgi:ketosteroid isomerase-like protein
VTDRNIQTVQKIYEAFGRGDVAFILDQVADDVDWASEPDGLAPWHGVYKGKGEVPKFFEGIAAHMEVTEFTPLAFASSDTDVMAVVRFGMRIPATGKQGAMDIHHWFRFTPDGKVCLYRGTEDTRLTEELLTASSA